MATQVTLPDHFYYPLLFQKIGSYYYIVGHDNVTVRIMRSVDVTTGWTTVFSKTFQYSNMLAVVSQDDGAIIVFGSAADPSTNTSAVLVVELATHTEVATHAIPTNDIASTINVGCIAADQDNMYILYSTSIASMGNDYIRPALLRVISGVLQSPEEPSDWSGVGAAHVRHYVVSHQDYLFGLVDISPFKVIVVTPTSYSIVSLTGDPFNFGAVSGVVVGTNIFWKAALDELYKLTLSAPYTYTEYTNQLAVSGSTPSYKNLGYANLGGVEYVSWTTYQTGSLANTKSFHLPIASGVPGSPTLAVDDLGTSHIPRLIAHDGDANYIVISADASNAYLWYEPTGGSDDIDITATAPTATVAMSLLSDPPQPSMAITATAPVAQVEAAIDMGEIIEITATAPMSSVSMGMLSKETMTQLAGFGYRLLAAGERLSGTLFRLLIGGTSIPMRSFSLSLSGEVVIARQIFIVVDNEYSEIISGLIGSTLIIQYGIGDIWAVLASTDQFEIQYRGDLIFISAGELIEKDRSDMTISVTPFYLSISDEITIRTEMEPAIIPGDKVAIKNRGEFTVSRIVLYSSKLTMLSEITVG